MHLTFVALYIGAFLHALAPVNGCSRVNYDSGLADKNRIVVGRSMDWLQWTNSSLWAFPAGIERSGAAGNYSLTWKSKYGSVITTMYDLATVDGINSKGLVGNTLYLASGDYGERDFTRRGLSIGLWQQYFLDNYATVAEAVADLYTSSGAEKFQVVTKEVIPNVPSIGHIGLTDPLGDSAIMEYLDGKLVVHHSRRFNVLTNEPSYDQQLAIDEYWRPIENSSLPGTDRPADRFARLSHYIRVAPTSDNEVLAVSTTAGMLRAISVPLEPVSIDTPNISPTLWRTYADTRALKYYFEGALEPMLFWVDLTKLDLNETGQSMVLTLNGTWTDRLGDMSTRFLPAAPFVPITVES
ncbi:MAG: hypothetical protein M1817_003910 [Caeruleum heppii]|nr:MAG: hypothetical protein M1817_003910 [Caeruleum heppii]